jgi:ligand-binding sensor domain-containing protein/serine phosphatase RsbU (regulator of sigma subunit)
LQGYDCLSQVYNFKTYNGDNGLRQNYIYSISQNKDGFLFISTGDGFLNFGGNKFRTFTTKDSIAENFVVTHFTDSRGITWLGHYQNGISYLKNDKFNKLKNSNKFESKVLSFSEDKKKNIWFAVQGKGVFYIDSNMVLQTPEFPAPLMANCILVDATGGLMCGTDSGLSWYEISDPKKPRLVCGSSPINNVSVKYIIQDALNKKILWLAIPGEGVYGITIAGNCYSLTTKISTELNSASKSILSIYSDHSANLWISISDEGLKKITFTDPVLKGAFSVQSINSANGLSNLHIQTVFEDFEKNMWFGTIGGGLIEMPLENFNFFKPVANSDIRSILIDKQGSFWLGLSKGFMKFSLNGKEESVVYDQKNGFVNDAVSGIYSDDAGKIWIGTQNNGLWIFDPGNNRFENFSAKNKLASLNINHITHFQKKKLIAATDEGVYFIDLLTEKTLLLTTVEGLLHNNVIHVLCDSKDRIWFSSHATPPYFLLGDEFTVLQDIPEMKSFAINSVNESPSGLIWIATNGDGVFSYDGKSTRCFNVDNGMLSNFCYAVNCGNNNDIWVTHNNGLSLLRDQGKSVRQYNRTDGLLFPENNLNAIYKDVKGELWFGTSEGVVRFYHPSNHISRSPEPKTRILHATINGKKYEHSEIVSLPYDEYNVRIDFIGVSLSDPSKVNYKYRLEGFDTTWRFTNERFIEYPKLHDGSYTFRVFACNKHGVWNTEPAEFSFKISVPIWKRAWFWILSLMIFLGLIYLTIRKRIKHLERSKMILERNIAEKTLQLREEKMQLVKTKEMLELKNKDVTDSINYAKNIQDALLPGKDSFLNFFPKTFIYYKPRNIVSGDFYWFTETENSYIIAVIDCTGHGIPGAFMSLIGSTLMNEIVNNRNITLPSEILHELHLRVVKTLKQDVEGSSSRDGMDVSLCSIDKAMSKLTFSSAARPMYYVRNGLLNEVNLKTYSIGGYYDNVEKSFSDIEIILQPGDQFYLFSDGYADQFNGINNKKFSSKRLKELLTEISGLQPEEQYGQVDAAFNNWKGEQGQIDDITIIGFKI